MKITLIGLGTNKSALSQNAINEIKSASKVLCKTKLAQSSKVFEELGVNVFYLDEYFTKSRNFDTLSKKIAKRVLTESKDADVVYCVDGAVADDVACSIIIKRNKNTKIIEGVSHTLNALSSLDTRGGYTAISAYAPEKFNSSVLRPFVLYDIDSPFICSEWKIRLTDAFGDDAPAVLYLGGKAKKIKLYEMDRFSGYDYRTVLVVKDQPFTAKKRFCIEDLHKIVRALRAEDGCPWDKAQTRYSIRKDLLEECYELYDAIERDDTACICEETGDVLLQVIFHSIFGEENHEFTLDDVVSDISNKLIYRHTHVFGADKANSGEEALSVWEKNKAKEKGFESGSEYINSVPKAFPALMRAEKVQKRASKYNFDFSSIGQIYSKLGEELAELHSAEKGEGSTFEEVGDLLFTVVNIARFLGVNAEQALNYSTDKFSKRFERLENAVRERNEDIKSLTEKQLDEIYNEIKKS